uniref:HIRA-interacting protein 3-like n=1 Tax=Haplochromis burtoni TaxID=8153 RepID=A0A3Q2WM65_HAPBU
MPVGVIPREIDEVFRPFVSTGFLSLSGDAGDRVPIIILRDTGAKHSVARRGVVSFSQQSYCGSDLLVWGIKVSMLRMPLHTVTLTSSFISGAVRVGVRDQLPIEGIDLVLGNDLAGGKVFPAMPEVIECPTSDRLCQFPSELGDPRVFPACVVTRAQARRLGGEVDISEMFPDGSEPHDSSVPGVDGGMAKVFSMVSEKEAAGIRRFVCGQLRDEADLSTLILGILKKRYQAHNKCDSLSPEVKTFMEQVVQEELMKMHDNDESESDSETKKLQNKRKRENGNDEVMSESEDESRAKKSQNNHSSSSSESEAQEDNKTESEESSNDEENAKSQADGEEPEVKKSQQKRNENRQIDSDESSDEELSEESNCSDSPKKMVRMNVETVTSSKDEGRRTPLSDAGNESDGDSKSETSDKIKSDESSDSEKEDTKVEKKTSDPDSDSSLPSLEDEKENKTDKSKDKKKMKKSVKKDESTRKPKSDDKSVARLKRYIALCGVRRNYKKLLEDCRSIRSQVAVLKKELEELGVHGQPTIQKCKKVRMKREQAHELAALDVNNIITTQGRPTRRGTSASQKQQDCPSSGYQRTLNSGSD